MCTCVITQVAKANEMKTKGNDAFRAGNYKEAFQAYDQVCILQYMCVSSMVALLNSHLSVVYLFMLYRCMTHLAVCTHV